jgi:hypothetical protein
MQTSDVTEGEVERAAAWTAMRQASEQRVAALVADRDTGEANPPRPPVVQPSRPSKAAKRTPPPPTAAPAPRPERERFTEAEFEAYVAGLAAEIAAK